MWITNYEPKKFRIEAFQGNEGILCNLGFFSFLFLDKYIDSRNRSAVIEAKAMFESDEEDSTEDGDDEPNQNDNQEELNQNIANEIVEEIVADASSNILNDET
jgi:hypothetical protein